MIGVKIYYMCLKYVMGVMCSDRLSKLLNILQLICVL